MYIVGITKASRNLHNHVFKGGNQLHRIFRWQNYNFFFFFFFFLVSEKRNISFARFINNYIFSPGIFFFLLYFIESNSDAESGRQRHVMQLKRENIKKGKSRID